ncbi:MAG TPA: hypothetical protein EYP63_06465 [Desulfotomaculum sp.]|nr:hypothetical protein [Desulfotomaculum sp.]
MPVPVQQVFSFLNFDPDKDGVPVVPIDETFPEEAANELASLESFNKHLYRPNTYLHKWWARRSGTTFRYILKQLVADPAKRDFYEPGGLEGKIILDPLMGGGTTLHEAVRMGANVIGVDIDPIPVLQVRASLNWIPVEQKIKAFKLFFNALHNVLYSFYQTRCPVCQELSEVQFVLYGLRRRCGCREVLFVDNLVLRENNNKPSIKLCGVCGEVYGTAEVHCNGGHVEAAILTKGQVKCGICYSPFQDILEEPFPQRYRPLVIVGVCPAHSQFFKRLDEDDRERLKYIEMTVRNLHFLELHGFNIPTGPKSDDLHRRNIRSFLELFTPRQLIYLHTAIRLLADFPPDKRLWLSLLISTSLEFNSLLCGYKGVDRRRPGAIRHVFSHHAYSFPYTALENNPVFTGKTSGTLRRLFFDRVARGGRWAMLPTERRIVNGKTIEVKIHGEVDGGQAVISFDMLREGDRRFYVFQGDSRQLPLPDESVDYVVTDPPYYDNVQYSDLSNFFRVWLRLFLPEEADWRYDQYASAVFEGEDSQAGKYAAALAQIWEECARVVKKETGRLVFTFHHFKPEAWAELTISLKRAGFVLLNRYVVLSENPTSVHIRTLKALKHDVILVLRPNSANSERPQWSEPSRIEQMDSYAFSRDCGAALGWFLNAELSEEQIHSKWKNLLVGGGRNNDKASG